MSYTGQKSTGDKAKQYKDLEQTIDQAIKKVRGNKENDLCKYIPVDTGGYMHHFTLRKMKSKDPSELGSLIEKFILSPPKPSAVAPKQRAARGSRKRKDLFQFSKNQLDRLLNIARLAGDKEMIALLSPKKSLSSCKRQLMNAVKNNEVRQDYWDAYVEAIQQQKAIQNSITEASV